MDPKTILGKRKREEDLTIGEMQALLDWFCSRINEQEDRTKFLMLETANLMRKSSLMNQKIKKFKRAKDNKQTYWLNDPLNPDNINMFDFPGEPLDEFIDYDKEDGCIHESLDDDTESTEEYSQPPPSPGPSSNNGEPSTPPTPGYDIRSPIFLD